MVEEDARSMLTMIEERIRSSAIQIEHRDALIRLRAMIEDDLAALETERATAAGSTEVAMPRARPTPTCLEF